MSLIWGKEGLTWLFYVPSFICGTLIGGSIAYVFLRKLAANGALAGMQQKLGSLSYHDQNSVLSDSVTIAALGAILWVVIEVAASVFSLTAPVWNVLAYLAPAVTITAGAIYYITKKVKTDHA
jgi:hypothetical protein